MNSYSRRTGLEAESAKIALRTAEFLANGGNIDVVPTMASEDVLESIREVSRKKFREGKDKVHERPKSKGKVNKDFVINAAKTAKRQAKESA